jgi:hypothetical protein
MQSYRPKAKLPAASSLNSDMAINQIALTGATELRRVAEWMENSSSEQSEAINRRFDQKTTGDEIRLLAYFPESKPFWDENAHVLQCFACDFSQKRTYGVVPDDLVWMTKRIRKGDKTHIVAFCAACMSGEPWTIHSKSEYTLLRINADEEKSNDFLQQQRKRRHSNGWPSLPKEAPFYKNSWGMGDMYDRPFDAACQSKEYDRKVKIYDEEKEKYDNFIDNHLKKIPEIETPTSSQKNKIEELRIRDEGQERVMAFGAKRYPDHPAYAQYIKEQKRKKKQKKDATEKHDFNSLDPNDKENKENFEK